MSYCVSSVLATQSGNSYGLENLWDGDDSTAWCEGAAGSTGEYLALRVSGGPPFHWLVFNNGYAKSTTAFTRNAVFAWSRSPQIMACGCAKPCQTAWATPSSPRRDQRNTR